MVRPTIEMVNIVLKYVKSLSLIVLLLCGMTMPAFSQSGSSLIKSYPFVNTKENSIRFYGKSEKIFKNAFRKMSGIDSVKGKQFKIFHLGDSHIQADFFPDAVRKKLQTEFPGKNGGRGFIFPYVMANTYQPKNYSLSFSGEWTHATNMQAQPEEELGLAGICVMTQAPEAAISLSLTNDPYIQYTFNTLRIFVSISNNAYALKQDSIIQSVKVCKDSGYVDVIFKNCRNEATVTFVKTSDSGKVVIYGFVPLSDSAGVVYGSTGVTGAAVTSFLKCSLLESQLRVLAPDLLIISLGTNDASAKRFSTAGFQNVYGELIRRVRNALPETAILLTAPGDSNRRKKRPNPNNKKAEESIFSIAEDYDAAVWDFYAVMGGARSIKKWFKAGLCGRDRVHLTKRGYELQGELLYRALIEAGIKLK
jgi:lysophospholipase L1-like esterase